MFSGLLKKILGSSNQRYVDKLTPEVEKINQLETQYQSLSDEQLKAKTAEFKARYEKGESLDDMLYEAFATVKNACRRMCGSMLPSIDDTEEEWNMVPYDVQLMGGMVMHRGGIAEMQTGEGKTLTASLPLYLNALTGKNVQLVTTNDFLARRDSQWIGNIFRFLDLNVGCIQSMMPPEIRQQQYRCDVTYGTNSEFGFDYLRDRGMATDKDELAQRDHYFVIIDEIDSILIDEARTPLIISGPVDVSTHRFDILQKPVERLFKKQAELCNDIVFKAIKKLESSEPKSDDYEEAIMDICTAKVGMPKHKKILKLMENTEYRRAVEKQELLFYSDSNRGLLQRVKEELFFSIDERHGDATLSEKGRKSLSGGQGDAYMLPDILVEYDQIDQDESLNEEQRVAEKQKVQDDFDIRNEEIHNISQLIRAYCIYDRDTHYIVAEDKVVIVDENTGYPMPGRRFSEGLHQALEAKEGVKIEKETQTLATVTIQNYFRMYDKLSGMTGTAETEAGEFKDIYGLDVVAIPTNRPNRRTDLNDRVYKTHKEKYKAIADEVARVHAEGRPILLGTPTVDVSEILSRYLKGMKLPHNVLNARRHQDEAEIIANAGQRSAITIATNMAGRGTDIKLGDGIPDLGGLMVIGAARHDSRRIDRQLRGRCARQGDPGSTLFFISLEDDLMRLFGSDRLTGILERLGLDEGEELQSPMLTRTIEKAQKRVENNNFSMRKRTLEYDDVMNKQRGLIYGRRFEILNSEKPTDSLLDILRNTVEDRLLSVEVKEGQTVRFEKELFIDWASKTFPITFDWDQFDFSGAVSYNTLAEQIYKAVEEKYLEKVKLEDDEMATAFLEQHIMLTAIDKLWKEHLHAMDHLRQGVQFSGIAQKDPLIEYKTQAYTMFNELIDNVAEEVVSNIFRSFTSIMAMEQLIHNVPQEMLSDADMQRMAIEQALMEANQQWQADANAQMAALDAELEEEEPVEIHATAPIHREEPKIGRNDPCPCGSGRKFKVCHGKQG